MFSKKSFLLIFLDSLDSILHLKILEEKYNEL